MPIDPNLPSERLIKLKKMIKPKITIKKINLNFSNKKIKKNKLSFQKTFFNIIHIWNDW